MRRRTAILYKIILSGCSFVLILSAGFSGAGVLAMEQEYLFPESAAEYMTEEDLAGLPAQILAYGKYEIYARHGMLFKSEELSEYFGDQSWYFGFIEESSFPANLLNEYETANIDLIESVEASSLSGAYVTDQEDFSYEMILAYLAGEDITQWETVQETESAKQPETESAAEDRAEKMTEPETEAAAQTEMADQLKLDGKNEDIQNIDILGAGPQTPESNALQPETQAAAVSESEYIFPDAATRFLTQAEVDKLSLQAACYAKNEIYARHGRIFLSQELQDYFNSKSWYMGIIEPDEFSDLVFNDYEKKNLLLIVDRENALASGGYQLDQPGYDISKVNTAAKSSLEAAAGN